MEQKTTKASSKKSPRKKVANKGAKHRTRRAAAKYSKVQGHCSEPISYQPALSPDIVGPRREALVSIGKRWMNGTKLRYHFFESGKKGLVEYKDGSSQWLDFSAPVSEMDTVRDAFQTWKNLDIGLDFEEVLNREDAEIRIGFLQGDGSWSYVGVDVLGIKNSDVRTMNFGWNISASAYGFDTALHEIGHTLGMSHEHQNNKSGIVWDEDAVIKHFAGSPNNWSEETTRWNILRKISGVEVEGSNWDRNSIMHYQFASGLIRHPEEFQNNELNPDPGLSNKDRMWVRKFYPSITHADQRMLSAHRSELLGVLPGGQAHFKIQPKHTRRYSFQLFGEADCAFVLFEEENPGALRFRVGEDDSGTDNNARMEHRMQRGRTYILRVKLNFANDPENISVLMW